MFVTRDADGVFSARTFFWKTLPKKNFEGIWWNPGGGSCDHSVPNKEFKEQFGYVLYPGEIRQWDGRKFVRNIC